MNGWVNRPTGRDLFLTGDGPAADWQPRQAAGVFGFLSSQHGPKLNKVVAALGGDVVAHAPDFFQNLVFHTFIIPSVRAVCRPPARGTLRGRKRSAASIASLHLLHHQHRDIELVTMAPLLPPIACGLLLPGDQHVAARPGGQQAWDRCFQIHLRFHRAVGSFAGRGVPVQSERVEAKRGSAGSDSVPGGVLLTGGAVVPARPLTVKP